VQTRFLEFGLIAALAVSIGCANKTPVISLGADTLRLPGGVMRLVTMDVVDPEGDPVTVTVSADRGFAIVEAGGVRYTAPADAGDDNLHVQANDGTTQVTATLLVTVDDPMAWSEPEQISATTGNSKSPALAVTNDGTVHVAWHDFTDDPPSMRYAALSDAAWEVGTLELGPDKVLRPQLLADGSRLHLVYERFLDGDYDVLHTELQDGAWSEPAIVGQGRKGSPALFDGQLHVAWFGPDDEPSHAWLGEQGWTDEGLVPIAAPFINPIRLSLVATVEGLELGILLSPGATSYDMNVLHWTAAGSWEDAQVLYVSDELGAEEPAGATSPSGVARWAWAEQDPLEPWTYDIVTMASTDAEPTSTSLFEGFNASPAIAVPSDLGVQVAFLSEASEVYVARQPFVDEPLLIGDAGLAPQLSADPDGYVHLVWIGDGQGIEQVFYASTRPR
jgi:hypothetical protein